MKKLLIIAGGFLLLNFSIVVMAQTDERPENTSIAIQNRAIKNAPFSAEAVIENVQTLFDGNKIKRVSKELQFRDSEGRFRRETEYTSIIPRKTITINDPVAGFNYYLNPLEKTAVRVPITSPNQRATAIIAKRPTGYSSKREDLGSKTIEGLEATGSRTITKIAPETIGNEKEIESTLEFWSSRELRTPLVSKRIDPVSGDNTFQLKNIKREEPDASLFKIPTDYKVIDQPIRTISLYIP